MTDARLNGRRRRPHRVAPLSTPSHRRRTVPGREVVFFAIGLGDDGARQRGWRSQRARVLRRRQLLDARVARAGCRPPSRRLQTPGNECRAPRTGHACTVLMGYREYEGDRAALSRADSWSPASARGPARRRAGTVRQLEAGEGEYATKYSRVVDRGRQTPGAQR